MDVIIVGTGKLASELLNALGDNGAYRTLAWANKGECSGTSIVVHAGSGRELDDVIAYCRATHSALVELATGSAITTGFAEFPVVRCPNTNILMLKFMSMLARSGATFSGYRIELTESHQAGKTSMPGTAVSMAQALGLKTSDVLSVRDRQTQATKLHIPVAHLGRHAYHQIVIEDDVCRVTMETRVYGASPYADGVKRILGAIRSNVLERRLYEINEFVEKGWV